LHPLRESVTHLHPRASFFPSSAAGPQLALLPDASRTREGSGSLRHRRTCPMHARAPATSPARDQPRLPCVRGRVRLRVNSARRQGQLFSPTAADVSVRPAEDPRRRPDPCRPADLTRPCRCQGGPQPGSHHGVRDGGAAGKPLAQTYSTVQVRRPPGRRGSRPGQARPVPAEAATRPSADPIVAAHRHPHPSRESHPRRSSLPKPRKKRPAYAHRRAARQLPTGEAPSLTGGRHPRNRRAAALAAALAARAVVLPAGHPAGARPRGRHLRRAGTVAGQRRRGLSNATEQGGSPPHIPGSWLHSSSGKHSRAEGDRSTETPKAGPRCVAPQVVADTSVDVTCAPNTATRTRRGVSDRSALAPGKAWERREAM